MPIQSGFKLQSRDETLHCIYLFCLVPRMTILPTPEKLKILLEKLKEFHLRFLQEYSQPKPQMTRTSQDQHREISKQPD